MKLLLCLATLAFALPASAEVVVYNFTGKHQLISDGAEYKVSHKGHLILDSDTGQGYQVDTWKFGSERYVRVTAVEDISYLRAIGRRFYTVLSADGGATIGIGNETSLPLSPSFSVLLPRTFRTSSQFIDGEDDLNVGYSTTAKTFSFSKRITQFVNLNFYDALFVTMLSHQDFINRGYIDLTFEPRNTSGVSQTMVVP